MSIPSTKAAKVSVRIILLTLAMMTLPPLIQLARQGIQGLAKPDAWLFSAAIGIALAGGCGLYHKFICIKAKALAEDRSSAIPLLSSIINASSDLGEVYRDFVAKLGEFIPIDRAAIAVADEKGEEFRIYALSARRSTELEQERFYPIENSRFGWMLAHNRPALTDDISGSSFWDWQALAEEGLHSVAEIPLKEPRAALKGAAAPTIGIFSLASYKTSAYHQQDLEFLSRVGEQLSCAVANSRRHEDARERIRWLEMMHHLEDALGRTLEIEEMLRIASDHAVQAMKADRILAVLPEEGIFKRGGAAEERCRLAGVGIRPGGNWYRLADFGPLVNAPVERMAPMLSRLVVEESIAGTPLETMYHGEGIRSLAVMPILSGGVCLGILLVGWRREGAISQESLQMLQDLAEHLGVGLRNANLAAALKAAK